MGCVYELSSNDYTARFHVKQCAEVFKLIYGGEINEIQSDTIEQDEQTIDPDRVTSYS